MATRNTISVPWVKLPHKTAGCNMSGNGLSRILNRFSLLLRPVKNRNWGRNGPHPRGWWVAYHWSRSNCFDSLCRRRIFSSEGEARLRVRSFVSASCSACEEVRSPEENVGWSFFSEFLSSVSDSGVRLFVAARSRSRAAWRLKACSGTKKRMNGTSMPAKIETNPNVHRQDLYF